jgi:hypothetical protein
MAANASARGQCAAIMASPLHQLTGFYLTVDCRSAGCGGERTFAISDLAWLLQGQNRGRRATPDALLARVAVAVCWPPGLIPGPRSISAFDRGGRRCWARGERMMASQRLINRFSRRNLLLRPAFIER